MPKKTLLSIFWIGGLGGVLFSVMSFFFLNKYYAPSTANGEVIKEIVRIMPQSGVWEDVASSGERVTVLITVYKGGHIIGKLGGLVLTNDGIIATIRNSFPLEADAYQVFIDNEILKARVVYNDKKSNLVLLQADKDNLSAVSFGSQDELNIGTSILVLSRGLDINKSFVAARQSIISTVTPFLSISLNPSETTDGMVIFNDKGAVLGILDTSQKQAKIIGSKALSDVLKLYTSSVEDR